MSSALVLCSFVFLSGCEPRAEVVSTSVVPKVNVLLIVVDTLRADHLAAYGYERKTAPAIKRLAEESVVFENAFTVMGHTLPAHVSLMTGVHPARHHVLSNGWKYDGRFPTLAERLQADGYETAAFVSSFVLESNSGLDAGFDTYENPSAKRRRTPGEETTIAAQEWLRSRTDEPFFAWVHYFDTHTPYERLAGDPWPLEIDAKLQSLLQDNGTADVRMDEIIEKPVRLNGKVLEIAEAVNAYDNEIRRVDRQVAKLLLVLEEIGAANDTLVIFTADHGEGLGEHDYYSHGLNLYEEQIHIPLIVRLPGAGKGDGHRVERAVSLLDLAPTVLDLIDHDTEFLFKGQSLVADLSDSSPPVSGRWLLTQRRWFSEKSRKKRGGELAPNQTLHALRGDARFKFVQHGDGAAELYDISADPHEDVNLFDDQPADASRLEGKLDELLEERTSGRAPTKQTIDDETREALEALGYIQ
jgi:arylsulfatase A-like enzyme